MWHDFDPDDPDEDEPFEDEGEAFDSEPTPTSGERLLHALGQLHRLHLCGRLPAPPSAFDVEDLARIVGVWPQLELVVADEDGTRYHFAGEVLAITASDGAAARRHRVRSRTGLEALVGTGGLGRMSTTGPDLLVAAFLALSEVEQDEASERIHGIRVAREASTESELGRYVRSLQRVAAVVGHVPTKTTFPCCGPKNRRYSGACLCLSGGPG